MIVLDYVAGGLVRGRVSPECDGYVLPSTAISDQNIARRFALLRLQSTAISDHNIARRFALAPLIIHS